MRWVCVVMVALFWMGCDKNATLVLRDRGAFHARIVDGNERQLWVVHASTNHVESIPREEVVSIDHPGDVWITTGAMLLGVALAQLTLLSVMEGRTNQDTLSFGLIGMAPIVGVGGLVMFQGLSVGAESRRNTYRTHANPPASGLGWLWYFE